MASSNNPTATATTLSTHVLPADPQQRKLLLWGLAATAATVTGAGIWWLTRESYYSYVPIKYQYRPGTLTGYISNVLARHAKRRRSRRPIRVYMDGCFDLMHYGHANALRQAKTLGDELVVGLVPDREILRCKGPPLMNEDERLEMVESVKWVDEVVTDVPYDLTPAFLHELFYKHKIDYVIHGDDPCLMPDGTDAYAYAKEAGRFRMIKRTEGVSTTDIVGRMLMCSRVNARFTEEQAELAREFSRGGAGGGGDDESEFDDDEEEEDEVRSTYSDASDGQHHIKVSTEDSAAAANPKSISPANVTPRRTAASAGAAGGSTKKESETTSESAAAAVAAVDALESLDSLGPLPPPHSIVTTTTTTRSSSIAPRKATGSGTPSAPVRVSHFMPTSRRIVQFSSGKSPPQGGKVVYIDGAFDLFHVGHVEILKAARAQGDFLLVGIHTDEEVTGRRGPHLPIMGLHERALSVLACRYADEVIIGAPQIITEDLLTTFGIGLVVRGTMHEAPNREAASEGVRYEVPRKKEMLRELPSPSQMTSAILIRRIVENREQFEERQKKKVVSEEAYYGADKHYITEA
jgi:cytidyltransferase-like protein